MRFRVGDLAAAHAAVQESGLEPGPVDGLPGVVSWFDVTDPWGNRLGCYQDLAPTGAVPGPGGSVHDQPPPS